MQVCITFFQESCSSPNEVFHEALVLNSRWMHGPVLSKYDETCYSSLRQERQHLECTSSRTFKMNNHPRTTSLTRYEASSAALCCLLAFFAAFAAAALAFFASARAAYEDQR